MQCNSCKSEITSEDKFCPSCGASQKDISSVSQSPEEGGPKTIKSSGNYSGKMVRSGSKFWKRLRNAIIIFILLVAIALIIWFQVDPEAGRKLKEALMGGAFMIVFFFFGWLFFRGKKRRGGSGSNDLYDHDDDDDDDDDGDD